jgi:hypothetical protein
MVRAWRCRSWRAYLENRSAFGSFPLPECCGNRASSYGFNRGKMEDQHTMSLWPPSCSNDLNGSPVIGQVWRAHDVQLNFDKLSDLAINSHSRSSPR